MVLYGRNPVRECVRAGRRRVRGIWATKGAADEFPGATVVPADEVARRSGTEHHQGVCAEVEGYPYVGAHELLAVDDGLLVVLDEVQDPQNLGAIARTVEGVGATGLVIPERRSAEVTPAAVKASAGALEWLRVARVRNVADFLGEAKDAGGWVYGAAGDGGDYLQPDYRGRCVLVLGAEGKGLRPRVRDTCDALVALPLRGHLDSLNVSAAAAALLYGVLQRRLQDV
jgi:23S rRNA (guanosine2251-2'-O)-methyltransferase